ncbi:hypothetical protein QR680_008545 [Steinernema hermaphroditum]|uniref:Uncharacterized protein n=1 Tax=Steinernema hermaphroditum TaxID=289476 RepID=A0AA39M8A4_9BILA|nr:hypothetical protein QR680_008545 [Steinernema hermaphroditum]
MGTLLSTPAWSLTSRLTVCTYLCRFLSISMEKGTFAFRFLCALQGASFVATLSPLPVYLANGSSSPPSSVNIPGPAPKRQRHQDRHHQEHSSNHHSSSTPRCSNSAAETAGSSGSAAPAQRRQTGQRPRGQPRADRPTRPARLERWISGEMRRLFEEMREMRTTVEALASRTPSEAGTSSAPKPANPTVADDAEKPTLHNSEKAL